MSRSRAALVVVLAAFILFRLLTPPAGHAQARRAPGPIRIVLLVDSSQAMASMLTHFRAALHAFLDTLQGNPEVAFISTGGQIRVRVPPTTDREVLRKAVSVFASDGGANSFLDTMVEADKRFLKVAPDKRSVFVMLMTDNGAFRGEPRLDEYNRFMNQFVDRGGRAHALIVTNVANGVTVQILRNLTNNTNGFYDTVQIPNPLADRMKALVEFVALDQL
jgi:Mg-chelatase subunit ChlD